MGSPFATFYPQPLQVSVKHAEGLVDALRRIERELSGSRWVDPNEPTEAERWIEGRPEEIEAFVSDVLREWREGLVSPESATYVIDGYVRAVHDGFVSNFGKPSPGCCVLEERATLASRDIKTAIPSRTKDAWRRLYSFIGAPTPTPTTPRVA